MSQSNKPKQAQYTEKIDPRETGTWVAGMRNQEMLTLFGELIADWVHLEEAVIDVMDLLIFPNSDLRRDVENKSRGFLPGRQIFRSMSSNGVRAKVLVALLDHFPGNDRKKTDPTYKHLVSEFQSLVALRNDYLHGLWWTKHNGDVYLQTENLEHTFFNRKRRIPKVDFTSFIKRIGQLTRDIEAAELKEFWKSDEHKQEVLKRASSRQKPQ